MIRYIKLKNYKSFTDITLDFTGKNDTPKPLIIIYGENGSGKTNIINVFSLLLQTFETMQLKSMIMEILEDRPEQMDSRHIKALKSLIDIEMCIQEYKTKGSSENMLIEIGFLCGGKIGTYILEFSDTLIVHEKLEYTLSKNKGIYFDITPEFVKINTLIVKNEYLSDLRTSIIKFWGKHSLMSILYYDLTELSDSYMEDQLSDNFKKVLTFFNQISCHVVDTKSNWGTFHSDINVLENFTNGTIDMDDIELLRQTEAILNNFFTNVYRDIESVCYHITEKKDKLKYELFFNKKISGEIRDISYQDESCGTKSLIQLLPFFLAVISPGIVAIDEIDNGIHEVLLQNILNNLVAQNQDQLIITTHNSSFIDCYDYKDNIYFINVDEEGNRQLKALTDFNFRIQPDSNVLVHYLSGEFNGLPWNHMNIDFNSLTDMNDT